MLVGATGTTLLPLPSLADRVSPLIQQRPERNLDSVTSSITTVITTGRPARRDLHKVVNIGALGLVTLRQAGPLLPPRLVVQQAGPPLQALPLHLGRLLQAPRPQRGQPLQAPRPQPGQPIQAPPLLPATLTLSTEQATLITPPDQALALLTIPTLSMAQATPTTQLGQTTVLTRSMVPVDSLPEQAPAQPQFLHLVAPSAPAELRLAL